METRDWLETLFGDAALEEAWERVRRNGGGPGVDGVTLEIFSIGVASALRSLGADLTSGNYRPMPYRGVRIPKPDGGQRRLVVATVRDRVAMTAATEGLRPRLEPLFHPCSFAYRPGMGVHDALAKITEYRDRGLRCVLRADVGAFFDSVDHGLLEQLLGSAGIPDTVQALIQAWLKSAVAEEGRLTAAAEGLPQGLPLAPLLANLYLTPFDRAMVEQGWKLVRYADDCAVCCATPEEAKEALADAGAALHPLKLYLKESKTQITTFDEGFTFLGAGFRGAEVFPAAPHPYEAVFSPPVPAPRAEAPSGLPELRLRTLYIQQQGAHVGQHGGRLVISKGPQALLDLPAHHVDQLFLFGRVHLSAAAMAFCLARGLPVYLFSGRGHYYGTLLSDAGSLFQVKLAQYRLLDQGERRLAAATAIVRGKVANAAALLRRHDHNHPETGLAGSIQALSDFCRRAAPEDLAILRGYEGAAAATYFAGFGKCMRGPLQFAHRNRRPPTDPVNSLLSFGYTLLLRHVQSALAARGMDPVVGVYHESGRGHPALASDLLEELRAPVVDSLVVTLANRRQLVPDDFYFETGTPQPCLLKDEARARFLQAFENKLAETVAHPEMEKPVDWRRIIELQANRMRRFLLGETDTYVPYTWE